MAEANVGLSLQVQGLAQGPEALDGYLPSFLNLGLTPNRLTRRCCVEEDRVAGRDRGHGDDDCGRHGPRR
jgi:hypothetical protein